MQSSQLVCPRVLILTTNLAKGYVKTICARLVPVGWRGDEKLTGSKSECPIDRSIMKRDSLHSYEALSKPLRSIKRSRDIVSGMVGSARAEPRTPSRGSQAPPCNQFGCDERVVFSFLLHQQYHHEQSSGTYVQDVLYSLIGRLGWVPMRQGPTRPQRQNGTYTHT